MAEYGIEVTLNLSVEKAEDKISSELKKEGFGLVSRINMKDKFKEKLDVDYRKYLILGFCNPSMAYEAIEVEDNIGLLLPCNVVVYEKDDKTNVAVIKPSVAMSMVDNPSLVSMAKKIEETLEKAVGRL
ncbi:MAG: DUF302 domain-containing protein [Spirochaetaceae bacterium]|jgi:uncharacterized protein (DUF302 family)|nr:DUF302 domain-containing protein [Spirochaetaceae bacterium]